MAANAVGADDHNGADGIQHRALHLLVRQGHTLFSGLFGNLFACAFGIRRGWPFARQRAHLLAHRLRRPIGARPRRPLRLRAHGAGGFVKLGKERRPSGIDRGGIGRMTRGHCVDIIGIGPIKEGRGAELGVGGGFGHDVAFDR